MRTWRVIKWKRRPAHVRAWVPLDCPCGYEAECPASVEAPIQAVVGMGIVFAAGYKPPRNWLPDTIQCRKCGRIYE